VWQKITPIQYAKLNSKQNTMKMKRILIVVALTGFCTQATMAQFAVGAKVGANLNQFNQPGTIFGFTGGAFAKYKALPFLDVSAELLYNQQGGARQNYQRDFTSTGGNVSYVSYSNRSVVLHNLEVPLLIALSHPSFSDNMISPRLLLGAAYGMNLGAFERHEKIYTFSTGSVPFANTSDEIENVGSNYKQNQWGFIAGFAIDFTSGEQTCTLEVRYRQGINQLNNLNYVVPPLDSFPGTVGQEGDLYTSSLSISFAMTLFKF
jgi:Outer membrane protein beta-barrel domain